MRRSNRRATVKLLRQIKVGELNLGGIFEDINIRFEAVSSEVGFLRDFEKILEETGLVYRLTEFYRRHITQLYEELTRQRPASTETEDLETLRSAIELKSAAVTEGLTTSLLGAFIGRHAEVALLEKQERQNAQLPIEYAREMLLQLARRTWPDFPQGEAMPGNWPMLENEKAVRAEAERDKFLSSLESAFEEWYSVHRNRIPRKADIARIIYVTHGKYKLESAKTLFSRNLKQYSIDFKELASRKRATLN